MDKEDPFIKHLLDKIWEAQNESKTEESSKIRISDEEIKKAKGRMDAWIIPGKRKFRPRPCEVDLRREKEDAKQATSEESSASLPPSE